MKTIMAQRVAQNLVKFTQPVIFDETTTTRRCFYGEIGRDAAGEWHLRGTIVLERKGKDGFHPQDGATLSGLKGNEVLKLELPTEHLRRLISGFDILGEAAKLEGITLRSGSFVVARENDVVRVVEREHRAAIEQLIQNNHSVEFWDILRGLRPDITSQLANAELSFRRRAALAEFEQQMREKSWIEPEWEAFFIQNQWIFGIGLRFQFLSLLQSQANYGGANYTRKGEQKGEFLMHTEADERFTVLVEIKRPNSRIFPAGSRERPYRSGVPGFNTDFMNAVSQVQVNAHTWEMQGSRRDADQDKLSRANIRTISPRTLLVFGETNELVDDLDRRNAFELFRSNLTAPEIVTFDELLARARFIVNETVDR